MQTTLDLPKPLFELAQKAAQREGVTVDQFIGGAIELKLRTKPAASAARQKVQLPLVRSKHPGSKQLTAEHIAEILDDEDVIAGR